MTHIFDIDGTLVYYHNNEWLPGALETLTKLDKEGHQIILITKRNESDRNTIWSIENTKNTILKDLDNLKIKYTIIFDCSSPRVLHDDQNIFLDKRTMNQSYEPKLRNII